MNSVRSINRSLIKKKPPPAPPDTLANGKLDLPLTFPLHTKELPPISDADIVGRPPSSQMGINPQVTLDHEFYRDGVPEDSKPVHTVLKFIIELVLFLPKYIVFKPLRYIVFIATYPVRLIIYLLFYRVRIQISRGEDTGGKAGDSTNSTGTNTPHEVCPAANGPDGSNRHAGEDDIKFEVAEKDDDRVKSPQGIVPIHKRTESANCPRPRSNQGPGSPGSPGGARGPIRTPVARNRKKLHKKTFIFPRLLFNFDICHPPRMLKKTLVLDLDETLIHSLSRYNSSILTKNKGISVEVRLNNSGLTTLYHIYKRPHVDEFLSIVRNWYNLVCFTASIKEYADPVINYLEEQVKLRDKTDTIPQPSNSPPEKAGQTAVFSHRFYRDSCIFVEGKGYVKDLSVLTGRRDSDSVSSPTPVHRSIIDTPTPSPSPHPGRAHRRHSSHSANSNSRYTDLSKIVIVDNSPISYSHHKDNGVMIEGWINDPGDVELLTLLPLLNGLRFTSDVRTILSLKNGQSAFR